MAHRFSENLYHWSKFKAQSRDISSHELLIDFSRFDFSLHQRNNVRKYMLQMMKQKQRYKFSPLSDTDSEDFFGIFEETTNENRR